MGAGENVTFTILSSLFNSGDNPLLLIDEIETGLHESAQINLIRELNQLCNTLKCQIICTTHSNAVLRTLPPEGRILVESIGKKTIINPEVSAKFASGQLGSSESEDLTIYVEDKCANEIVSSVIHHALRKRVKIEFVGSNTAVLRHMAINYRQMRRNCMCFLDGDQSTKIIKKQNSCVDFAEFGSANDKTEMKNWVKNRLKFLPGSTAPEQWLLEITKTIIESPILLEKSNLLVKFGNINIEHLINFVEESINIGEKDGMKNLSKFTHIEYEKVIIYLIEAIKLTKPELFEDIISSVADVLNEIN